MLRLRNVNRPMRDRSGYVTLMADMTQGDERRLHLYVVNPLTDRQVVELDLTQGQTAELREWLNYMG